jgi:hypothetical protein
VESLRLGSKSNGRILKDASLILGRRYSNGRKRWEGRAASIEQCDISNATMSRNRVDAGAICHTHDHVHPLSQALKSTLDSNSTLEALLPPIFYIPPYPSRLSISNCSLWKFKVGSNLCRTCYNRPAATSPYPCPDSKPLQKLIAPSLNRDTYI